MSAITGVDPARALATLDVACRPKHHEAWLKSGQDVSFADSMEEFAMQSIQQTQRDLDNMKKEAFPWAIVAAVGASAAALLYVVNIFAPRRYH